MPNQVGHFGQSNPLQFLIAVVTPEQTQLDLFDPFALDRECEIDSTSVSNRTQGIGRTRPDFRHKGAPNIFS